MGSWEVVITASIASWNKNVCCYSFAFSLSLLTDGIGAFSFPLGRELACGKVLACRGRGSHFLSPVLFCLSPILFAAPLTFSLFLGPWVFFLSVPRQLFYPFLLSKQKMKRLVRWLGFPLVRGLWWCQISHCLAPGAKRLKGKKRGRDCSCKWAPAAQVCLHSKVKLIWTEAIILLLLQVWFCLVSPWWKTTSL